MWNTGILNGRHGRKGSLGSFQASQGRLGQGQGPKRHTLLQGWGIPSVGRFLRDASGQRWPALCMERAGAHCVYCTDSAGYLLPHQVTARIELLRQEFDDLRELLN